MPDAVIVRIYSDHAIVVVHFVTIPSGKVVDQLVSYEITEKHKTKSVSFHLKYWLKLTYAVVASTCMLIKTRSVNR